MNFKALLWDMDGTLINSESLYSQGFINANKKYSMNAELPTTGTSLESTWESIPDSEKKNLTYGEWALEVQQHVEDHFLYLKLFDSARVVIGEAHNRNVIQSCVSNNRKDFIGRVLAYNDVHGFFHHWIGCDDVRLPKPWPEPYQHSSNLLGIDPAFCLAVEDSLVGVASARAAGMKVALYNPEHLPVPANTADYVISCHRELLDLIQG